MIDEIHKILLVDEEEVVATLLKRNIEAEFEGHFGNVNHPRRKTTVDLDIKSRHIAFSTKGSDANLKVDQT